MRVAKNVTGYKVKLRKSISENELFDESGYVRTYVEEHMTDWNTRDVSVSQKWDEIFSHFANINVSLKNIITLVEFTLALPGTNAAVERIFSFMRELWTDKRNRLEVETVKAIIIVKTHYGQTCVQFYNLLISS